MWPIEPTALLSVLGCCALLLSKVKSRQELCPTLWGIWSIEGVVNTLAFFDDSPAGGRFLLVSTTAATVAVFLLALCGGARALSPAERRDMRNCLITVGAWAATGAIGVPHVGELCLLALGAIGMLAFFRQLLIDPRSESFVVWGLFLAAEVAALSHLSGESLIGQGFWVLETATSAAPVLAGIAIGGVAYFGLVRAVARATMIVPRSSLRWPEMFLLVSNVFETSRRPLAHTLADA